MDYIRKKRWVRYQHVKCKMYLRNDFRYKCAYCRLREQDTGVLSEAFFQKDHFVAQNSGAEIDLDAYDNMIYACEKCNRTKSDYDVRDILNPCLDDIYQGEHPQISSLGESMHYQLIGNTPEGQHYIDMLQLNSKFYRELRKIQAETNKSDNELKQIVSKMVAQSIIPDDSLKKLEKLLENRFGLQMYNYQSAEFRCGKSKAGDAFQNVLEDLEKVSVPYELLFAENDLDVAIQYQGIRYLCEIVLNEQRENQVTGIRPKKEKVESWMKKDGNYGILYYYVKTGRLDFYQLDREKMHFEFCVNISGM